MATFESQHSAKVKPNEALLRLAAQVDEFEAYSHPHASRMAAIANRIAEMLELSTHDRLTLREAALVHDLGELVMKRDYIKRGGMLSEDERLDMMRHTVIGEQAAAKYGLRRGVQLLVRWHQEWWNGDGYPDGLRRQQIPLAARVLRVVDTYAALTDSRPYNAAISAIEARTYLMHWSGLEFDPHIVKVFLALPAELPELQSFGESSKHAAANLPRL